MTEKFPEIYQPKPKFFGEKAERIQREEYESIVAELLSDFHGHFHRIHAGEQLEDKESFGDIDFICFSKRTIDELYFRKILGERLLAYHLEGYVRSVLIKLNSGK